MVDNVALLDLDQNVPKIQNALKANVDATMDLLTIKMDYAKKPIPNHAFLNMHM
jgi:hypothetical protein